MKKMEGWIIIYKGDQYGDGERLVSGIHSSAIRARALIADLTWAEAEVRHIEWEEEE